VREGRRHSKQRAIYLVVAEAKDVVKDNDHAFSFSCEIHVKVANLVDLANGCIRGDDWLPSTAAGVRCHDVSRWRWIRDDQSNARFTMCGLYARNTAWPRNAEQRGLTRLPLSCINGVSL
jgi:hypothetical protein